MNENGYSLSDIQAVTGGNRDGFFGGGDGGWWLILLFLFAFGGWGNGGWGGGGGASNGYVLASDFATIQRQLSDGFNAQERRTDAVINGICDLGYTQQTLANNIGMNMMQGFNATQAQLADCCCRTQQNIKDVSYNVATTGADIRAAIKDCCCEDEKQFMQTRYDMAANNCATLQAIDKVGDRIIDWLAADKAQTLRDENQALRLAASQQAQNNYLIGKLQPTPIPTFPASNLYGYYGCCGGFNNAG